MLTQQSRLRWAISVPKAPRLMDALTAARAPLLFGVRLWASVCLALFVAFWLELDNPYLGRHLCRHRMLPAARGFAA